jgi:hypothetical protein
MTGRTWKWTKLTTTRTLRASHQHISTLVHWLSGPELFLGSLLSPLFFISIKKRDATDLSGDSCAGSRPVHIHFIIFSLRVYQSSPSCVRAYSRWHARVL